MKHKHWLRFSVIAVLLVLGVFWALGSAKDVPAPGYPGASVLATAPWLQSHINDSNFVVVDVRENKYVKDAFIPGAVHLEWTQFQENEASRGIGGVFVGVDRAQEILGRAGIARTDTVILYDSVERDGGATSSYVFWILDVLGHANKMVLERGIEAWFDAGYTTVPAPRAAEAVLYQAPIQELRLDRWVDGAFVQVRLGDPFYQILDVRSSDEYLGNTPNKGLDGEPLKLGHVPTAFNVDYKLNWADAQSKGLKTYADLQTLYAGLDPNRSVVTYCHSGRRGSFSYFILRLMGFEHVSLYDASWNEWGNNRLFFPIETGQRMLAGTSPGVSAPAAVKSAPSVQVKKTETGAKPSGGYVSCGD
jgi:thiosulfate/3-mercaptopyruvate sulfurtransferase